MLAFASTFPSTEAVTSAPANARGGHGEPICCGPGQAGAVNTTPDSTIVPALGGATVAGADLVGVLVGAVVPTPLGVMVTDTDPDGVLVLLGDGAPRCEAGCAHAVSTMAATGSTQDTLVIFGTSMGRLGGPVGSMVVARVCTPTKQPMRPYRQV